MRTAARTETSAFISSPEADELSLPLLSKLQLPATETETETLHTIFQQGATLLGLKVYDHDDCDNDDKFSHCYLH